MTLTFHLTLEVPGSTFKFSGSLAILPLVSSQELKNYFPSWRKSKYFSTFLRPVPIETRQEIDEGHTTLCQATNSCLPSSVLGRRKGKKIYIGLKVEHVPDSIA